MGEMGWLSVQKCGGRMVEMERQAGSISANLLSRDGSSVRKCDCSLLGRSDGSLFDRLCGSTVEMMWLNGGNVVAYWGCNVVGRRENVIAM